MPDHDTKPTPIEASSNTRQPLNTGRVVRIALFVLPVIIVIVLVVLLLLPAFTPDTDMFYRNIITTL